MNSALEVVEETFFDYFGPIASCTGGEEVAAATEAGSKAAADTAATAGATDAATIAGDVGVAGTGAGGLGAETAAAGLGGTEAGIAALPGAFDAAGAGLSGATIPELGADVSAIEGAGVGAPAASGLAPQVGAGAVDIAGGDLATDAASIAGDTGLAPPPATAPVTDLSTAASGSAPVTDLSTAAKGTSGIGSSLLQTITKNPLLAGALGINAASAISANRAGKDAASQLKNAAGPFNDTGKDLLAQYKSGKLNPGDEFDINQWLHQAVTKANSQYGQGSTAARNAIGQLEAQAQAMREKAREGLLTEGLNAMNMGTGPLTTAIQAQAAQDRQLQAASGSALNSLMLLQAINRTG